MRNDIGRFSGRVVNYRVRAIYPHERPLRWGAYECASTVLFLVVSLIFVAAIAALVMLVIGFTAPTQLYGFDHAIGGIEVLF